MAKNEDFLWSGWLGTAGLRESFVPSLEHLKCAGATASEKLLIT
jgi:hypothetical protein